LRDNLHLRYIEKLDLRTLGKESKLEKPPVSDQALCRERAKENRRYQAATLGRIQAQTP